MKVTLGLLFTFAVTSLARAINSEDETTGRLYGRWRPWYGYGWRPYYRPSWHHGCYDQVVPQVEEVVDEEPEPSQSQGQSPQQQVAPEGNVSIGEEGVSPGKENDVPADNLEERPSQEIPIDDSEGSSDGRPQQGSQQNSAEQLNPAEQQTPEQPVEPVPSQQPSENQDNLEIPNQPPSDESVETINLSCAHVTKKRP
uniref:Uncharacterized protein n=1 Tax=Lygus hesperus TaxID=30085 RepID=A0A0K8T162_LYGHE